MDLVYIVSPGNDGIELRYSIRSMVKHLQGFSRIVIVGHKPHFLKGVIHLPAPDPHRGNPARNIYEKILLACKDRRITKQFICASDDHFLLNNFSAASFPFFYDGSLQDYLKRITPENYYRAHVQNTYEVLAAAHLPTLNYNIHAPVIYAKHVFKGIMPAYDWNVRRGYLSKSLYCNFIQMPPAPINDCVIKTPKTKTAIYRKISGAPFFSTGDIAMNAEMKEVLQELFPAPSQFEV